MKIKTAYAGFRDGKQITGWDLRRDKVYRTTRKQMLSIKDKAKRAGFEIREQPYIQPDPETKAAKESEVA